jgi:PKD repeat protein
LGHPGRDPEHGESTSVHSTTSSNDWPEAVMHWSIPQHVPSVPQTDDIQAIQYFYGTDSRPPPPVASFDYAVTDPTHPLSVLFFDTSPVAGTGWSWDFGDPASGTNNGGYQNSQFHGFTGPGTYTVTMVTGNFGGSSSATRSVTVSGAAACPSDPSVLCLNNGRFQVTANWEKEDRSTGKGIAVALTANTGYFWFFSEANIEVVTKVLGFCADPFNAYWVFAAGLTNVKTTLTYTDLQNGTVVTKENAQGTPFAPIQDTAAFKTCP